MFDCLAHERRKPVIADKVVISLASAERRNTTVPKLVDAGFRVLDAIDGRLMSKEEIAERFDTALFEDTFLHYPKPGEIGCTLSHLIAISDFAAAAGGVPTTGSSSQRMTPRYPRGGDVTFRERWVRRNVSASIWRYSACTAHPWTSRRRITAAVTTRWVSGRGLSRCCRRGHRCPPSAR